MKKGSRRIITTKNYLTVKKKNRAPKRDAVSIDSVFYAYKTGFIAGMGIKSRCIFICLTHASSFVITKLVS